MKIFLSLFLFLFSNLCLGNEKNSIIITGSGPDLKSAMKVITEAAKSNNSNILYKQILKSGDTWTVISKIREPSTTIDKLSNGMNLSSIKQNQIKQRANLNSN
jgi:glycine cleavage system regulatory protein